MATRIASMSLKPASHFGQSLSSGFDRQIAGGDSFIDNVPFTNAYAFPDPLIDGIDHFFQVGIGQKARRTYVPRALILARTSWVSSGTFIIPPYKNELLADTTN